MLKPKPNTERATCFAEVVHSRTAMRAFLPEPIPKDDIERALALACQAPSNCNTQPWLIAVASGALRDRLASAISSSMQGGRVNPDLPYDGRYEGPYQVRQYAAAEALYSAAGVSRDDKTGRMRQFVRNYDFFDAPHVAFFFLPPGFGPREAADLGMCAQTFMLALTSMGYGSCPQTALSFTPDLVREAFEVQPGWQLMFGMSFGRPDPSAPVNRLKVKRDVEASTVMRED